MEDTNELCVPVPAVTGVSEEEMDRSARKRGRAYQCLRCLHKSGREFIEVKRRVEAHIMRDHLRRDEVPHFCSLCQFRCQRREDLDNHLSRYRRHALLAQQVGIDAADTTCLKSNDDPYVIGPKDYVVLDKEESFRHWKGLLMRRQAGSREGQDPLSQAFQVAFPWGYRDIEEFLGEQLEDTTPEEATPAASPRPDKEQTSVDPQLRTAVVSLSRDKIRSAVAPLLHQLTDLIDPQQLTELVSENLPSRQEEAKDVSEKMEEKKVDLEVEGPPEVEESLMPILLPTEDQTLTPKRKPSSAYIPTKRMRSQSPSSSSESSCSSVTSASEEGHREMRHIKEKISALGKTVDANTRAIASLEQTMLTLAEAVTLLTKTIKDKNKSEDKGSSGEERSHEGRVTRDEEKESRQRERRSEERTDKRPSREEEEDKRRVNRRVREENDSRPSNGRKERRTSRDRREAETDRVDRTVSYRRPHNSVFNRLDRRHRPY